MHRVVVIWFLLLLSGVTQAATSDWWDSDYTFRRNVTVTAGAVTPDRGYDGYTLRIAGFDTQSLIGSGNMQASCNDLRVLFYTGSSWTELARHVIGCNSTATDIRFMSPVNLGAGIGNDNFYVYYGSPTASAPVSVSTNNVYLWYDDATVNRSASYIRGRIDPWHGTGWDNTLAWNAAGYYTYRNGDNFTSGYRLALDERDVFIEAEFFHVDCFPINMTTGLIVRGIIQSGSGGSENSNHYYASNRGDFPPSGCGNAGGYSHDGDIMRRERNQIAVDAPNPGDIVANQWRRQGLAAFGAGPTQLRFWDEDNSAAWQAIAFPANSNLQASGSDGQNVNGRGFVAIMTAQDQARLRNVVVRRYVEPEPGLLLGGEETRLTPSLTVFKSVRPISDDINGGTDPLNIPGAIVEYEIRVVNQGSGTVDMDSLVINEVLPAALQLLVTDIVPGEGPVNFVDGAGAASSGLTISFAGLSSNADDVAFSTDGVSYVYSPTPDGNGADANVAFIRITPQGTMNGAPTGGETRFSVFLRMRVP